MEICYKTNKSFSFRLSDWEIKTEAGKKLIEMVKNEIPKEKRSFFPATGSWLIAHSEKIKFTELITEFIFRLTEKRQEDFFV